MEMARRDLAPRDVRPSIEKVIAFLSEQIEETDRELTTRIQTHSTWRVTMDGGARFAPRAG